MKKSRILLLCSILLVLITVMLLFTACQDTPTTTVPTSTSNTDTDTTKTPDTTKPPVAMVTLPAVEPPTAETPYYNIVTENGKSFAEMDTAYLENNANNNCMVNPILYFSSLNELREKILTGDLSEDELRTFSQFTKDKDTGKIILINLNQLQKLVLPNAQFTVAFNGISYGYLATLSDESHGMITVYTPYLLKDYFNEMEYYDRFLKETDSRKVISDKTIEDRNAREVYIEKDGGQSRYLKYTYQNTHGNYTIYEFYTVIRTDDEKNVSADVPRKIGIFFTDYKGVYASMSIRDLSSRPTMEALTSLWFEPLATNTSGNDQVTE